MSVPSAGVGSSLKRIAEMETGWESHWERWEERGRGAGRGKCCRISWCLICCVLLLPCGAQSTSLLCLSVRAPTVKTVSRNSDLRAQYFISRISVQR